MSIQKTDPSAFYITVVEKHGSEPCRIIEGPNRPVYGLRYVILSGDRKGIIYHISRERVFESEVDLYSYFICVDGEWVLGIKPPQMCQDKNGRVIDVLAAVSGPQKSGEDEKFEATPTPDMERYVSALKTIKSVCKAYRETGCCMLCPFSSKTCDCLIQKTTPKQWEIYDQAKRRVLCNEE